MQSFTIRAVEQVHYELKIEAENLMEAKKIAKEIARGDHLLADFNGGESAQFGKLKTSVDQPKKEQTK